MVSEKHERRRRQPIEYVGPKRRIEDFEYMDSDEPISHQCCMEHGRIVTSIKNIQGKQYHQCMDYKEKEALIDKKFEELEIRHGDVLDGKVPFKVFSWAMTISATVAISAFGILLAYSDHSFSVFSKDTKDHHERTYGQISKIDDKMTDELKFISRQIDNLSERMSRVETKIETIERNKK